MTKDYAKNRPKFFPKRNNRYQPSNEYPIGLPSWAWMLLGLIFGIAISAFIFWKLAASKNLSASLPPAQEAQLSIGPDLEPKSKNKNKTKIANKIKKINSHLADLSDSKKLDQDQTDTLLSEKKKPETTPETRFDFYTLLPTISVESPDSEGTQASNQRSLPYILQAGSFKSREEAEQLKAVLALHGLRAQIQTVTINPSESWHRVYMGPFDTKADAISAQQTLEEGQSLNSVILKVRV